MAEEEEETITEEQIAKNYSAMLDYVALVNAGKPFAMSDAVWNAMKAANVNHLKLMRAKDYWTDEDMTAVDAAIGD